MRIDHKLQRIQVDSFEISDELVYRFLSPFQRMKEKQVYCVLFV